MPSRTRTARPDAPRTLWEEGRRPGTLVVVGSAAVLTLAILAELLLGGRLGLLFDGVLVIVCVAAALAVRPKDFFTVGVLPPLLLGAAVLLLGIVARGAVARPEDALVQAFVSGLAHHAVALSIGYGLTLAVLALRQVALRHHGRLRPSGPVRVRSEPSPEPEDHAAAQGATRR